jgi:hypothetical protein
MIAVKTACTYAVSESCIITRDSRAVMFDMKYNIARVRLVYLRQMVSVKFVQGEAEGRR